MDRHASRPRHSRGWSPARAGHDGGACARRRGRAPVTAAVALLVLLTATGPTPAPAQVFERTDRAFLFLETFAGLPFDLYTGTLSLDRGLLLDPGGEAGRDVVRALYRERVEAPVEVGGGVAWTIGSLLALRLSVRRGSGATEATYSGGGAGPQSLGRHVSWLGGDLVAAVPVDFGDRWSLLAGAGGALTRWTLDTRGLGSAALARAGSADGKAAPVEWGRRRWTGLGGVLQADLVFRVTPRATAALALRQRVVPVEGLLLARSDSEDLRRATGLEHRVTLRPRRLAAYPSSLGLVVSWSPGSRAVRDPGPRALAAMAVRAPPAESPPDVPGPSVREALERGDTASAVAELEGALARFPDDPRLKGELGLLLAHVAPSAERDFAVRRRAERLLSEALRGDPGNPRWYLGLSIVLEKAGRVTEARTVASRALAAAAERPEAISRRELAESFYRRGSSFARRVEDFHGLRGVPPDAAPLNLEGCALQGGAFCLNWDRPRRFFETFLGAPDLSGTVEDEIAAMREEFRRAVAADPDHTGARRALLTSLAVTREWDEGAAEAEAWAAREPEDPWAELFRTAFLVRAGRWGWLDRLRAREAVARLAPEERAPFRDLSRLLPAPDRRRWAALSPSGRQAYLEAYWRAQDPLHLADASAREMEHYARVALAELLFGEPQAGRRGWETDRGDVLVRYGLPPVVWQIRRDDRAILQPRELALEWETVQAGPGGPWIFWSYDPDEPGFIFEKALGRASSGHMFASQSHAMSEDERARNPTAFPPPFRDAGPIPHQAAVFRGDGAASYELEVHARVPAERLAGDEPPDSLLTGLFVFARNGYVPVAEAREARAPEDDALDFRVTGLRPGLYSFSLESALPDLSAAAVQRGQLAVGGYAPGRLGLSDVLLAHAVRPTVSEPTRRRELDVDPLRCRALPRDRTVHLVFELYGLGADEGGRGRYRVELRPSSPGDASLLVRFFRGLAERFVGPGAGESAIAFGREAPVEGDRTVDWLEVRLPGDAGQDVELELRVTDLGSGEETSRTLELSGAECS